MMFTLIFLLMTGLYLCIKLWLATRQIRCVARHFNQVPDVFAGQISLEAHQKAAQYTLAKARFSLLSVLFETLLLLGFTVLGGLEWLQTFTAKQTSGLGAGLLLIATTGLVSSVLELPLAYYQQFVLEARFGFNRMTLRLFFTDWIKGLLLAAAIGGPLIAAVLWLMQSTSAMWWLGAWGLWFGFSLLMMWLYPTVLAPLFNRFTPLPEGTTRERITHLLKRGGFDSNGLFVMDGSKRSSHGNAWFSGLGKAKRIVFFDTLLERLNDDQIEAVLAHELGHFKKKHIVRQLVFSAAFGLALFALLGTLLQTPWFYTSLGVTPDLLNGPHAMALILFSMVLPVFLFPLRPVMSWFSRKHEFEADAWAAQQSEARHLISALVKLYEDNASTLTPDPIYSAFYDSHPPASIRIAHLKAQPAHTAA